MDLETIQQVWRKRGFSCDLWVDSPGQRWEGYTQSDHIGSLLREGQMRFWLNSTDRCFFDAIMHHANVVFIGDRHGKTKHFIYNTE